MKDLARNQSAFWAWVKRREERTDKYTNPEGPQTWYQQLH